MTLADPPPTRHHGVTDVGLRRSNNEDALFADPDAGLFIVSDGMGGRNAGEVAAGLVVSELPQLVARKLSELVEPEPEDIARALHEGVRDLSTRIYKLSEWKKELSGLGATVVMLYLREATAWVVNMGDSSAYVLRAGALYRLTDEHNIAAMMLEKGDITREEFNAHPARGVLSRHMGMKQMVYPDVRCLALAPGDRLLLCSDGLNSMVAEGTIEAMLGAERDPAALAQALIDAAKEAGGRDNVTALVVDPEIRPAG